MQIEFLLGVILGCIVNSKTSFAPFLMPDFKLEISASENSGGEGNVALMQWPDAGCMAGPKQRKWLSCPSFALLLSKLHFLFGVALAETERVSVLILVIWNGRVIKYRCVTADCMSVCVCV